MPTGYTSKACDQDVPFNEFVWDCARAFGALIMMRDDPHGTPIPERFEPSDHHATELAKAKLALEQAKKMSIKEAAEAAKASHQKAQERLKEQIEKVGVVNTRLNKLRDSVLAWNPPSPDHEGLKKFMLQQLDETIKWDGNVSDFYHDEAKQPMSGKEWRDKEIESAKRDIEYHTKEWAAEVKRTQERNQWISDLVNSVPYPGKMGKPRTN